MQDSVPSLSPSVSDFPFFVFLPSSTQRGQQSSRTPTHHLYLEKVVRRTQLRLSQGACKVEGQKGSGLLRASVITRRHPLHPRGPLIDNVLPSAHYAHYCLNNLRTDILVLLGQNASDR